MRIGVFVQKERYFFIMYAQRLEQLRKVMTQEKIDGFLVPQTDEFRGEYIPECAQRLQWISGFTGSSGTAVILGQKALALTNAIYTLQIRKEVDETFYEYADVMHTKVYEWIKDNAPKNAVIAYDPWLHTYSEIQKYIDHGLNMVSVDQNLIDKIWTDRPTWPNTDVFLHDDTIVGRTSQEKRMLVATEIKKATLDAFILSDPQSIAWLLNVRATDVPCTPLPLSYATLYDDGTVDWFVDEKRVPKKVLDHLGADIRVKEDTFVSPDVKKVGLDYARASMAFKTILEGAGCEVVNLKDPCIDIRACKTPEEVAGMKTAHIRDGRALTKALDWVCKEAPKMELTEMIVDRKLEECRQETGALQDLSFPAIVGWAENGAVVHYRVSEESSLPIKGQGLLLIDSGGQYLDGTTDVTRTISLGGTPTDEQKKAFTLVLKGHVAVATAVFPEGTTGAQIDLLARKALWDEGLDYGHGTGHGVGCYLSVHEEATYIAPKSNAPFKAGMVISNEPGYYKEGEFGIRIESLVVVFETGKVLADGRKMLGFETITMVPLHEPLINWDMLSNKEIEWVTSYQSCVGESLRAG